MVRRPEVKFVVISSDVVYPTGSMRHYEAKFWLPFMGTSKPVYAIPGNHDWYDALEGFAATFLEPGRGAGGHARAVEVDNRITSTTDARIEELIATASRLKNEYGVPTQLQQAPFFQFQTDAFALFAVDTGVARRVDAAQMAWLSGALDSARGKAKMAILGHPLYAGGKYTAVDNAEFAALHQLLREHDVSIVMAGDTHDLEYYAEPTWPARPDDTSLRQRRGRRLPEFRDRTRLARPAARRPTGRSIRTRDQVVAKIEATTPLWKRPAWWWTTAVRSLALLGRVAVGGLRRQRRAVLPELHRGPRGALGRNRIRLLPYGVHGRLSWGDLDVSGTCVPPARRRMRRSSGRCRWQRGGSDAAYAAARAGTTCLSAATKASISSGLPIETRNQLGIEENLRPTWMPSSRNASFTGPTSPPTSIMTKFVSEGMSAASVADELLA